MVDLGEIQAAYYMLAATGVLVAAAYYILNIRETNKGRQVALTSNLMQTFISEDGVRRYREVMTMQWRDFDDFTKKYGSLEYEAKRHAVWNTWDVLGYLVKKRIVDIETVFAVSGSAVVSSWAKWKPIIEAYREKEWSDQWTYWEYLASEMSDWKMKNKLTSINEKREG